MTIIVLGFSIVLGLFGCLLALDIIGEIVGGLFDDDGEDWL